MGCNVFRLVSLYICHTMYGIGMKQAFHAQGLISDWTPVLVRIKGKVGEGSLFSGL